MAKVHTSETKNQEYLDEIKKDILRFSNYYKNKNGFDNSINRKGRIKWRYSAGDISIEKGLVEGLRIARDRYQSILKAKKKQYESIADPYMEYLQEQIDFYLEKRCRKDLTFGEINLASGMYSAFFRCLDKYISINKNYDEVYF